MPPRDHLSQARTVPPKHTRLDNEPPFIEAIWGPLVSAADPPCLRVGAGIRPPTSELPGGCIEVTRASTSMLLAGEAEIRAIDPNRER